MGDAQRTFAHSALECLREVAYKDPENLPSHNDGQVQRALEEATEHVEALRAILARVDDAVEAGHATSREDAFLSDDAAASAVIHLEAIKRCKRLLLAYCDHRLGAIKHMRWRGRQHVERIRGALSPAESQFHDAYDEILRDYQRSAGCGDLTLGATPPREAHVAVLVKKDVGEVQFSHGWVSLRPGLMHMLPRSEIEHYVSDGTVEYVGDRELDLGTT
ncbi:unnamed protein product [Pedinophyceae sp. YPF-701]|nr:unnamed protein product [Pedinophyceae sp. YPF-701]